MDHLLFQPCLLDEKPDGHPLLNVENILIFAPIGALFFLQAVPMQVEQINMVEAVHQRLPHPPERRIVEVAVVGDETQNSFAGLVDFPLSKPDELNIIVL